VLNFRIIFDKIDENGDEKVTEEELTKWIKYVQSRYLRADTDKQWREHNPDESPTLTWTAYKLRVYAFIKGSLLKLFVILTCSRTHTVLTAIFQVNPGQLVSPDFQSPMIPILSILMGLAKTFHIPL